MMILLLAILLFALTSCSLGGEDPIRPEDNLVNAGDTLPAFSIYTSDGRQITTEQLKGKPSLIVFFSTGCPDCQSVLPDLERRYRLYAADTTYIAISREQAGDEVAAYWAQHTLSLPYSAQSDRRVYSLFARRGIPRIYISDAQGIVQRAIP